VDVKRFWIYVHTTRVKKGWDWVELPDGRRVSVPPGKYMRVFEVDGKPAFGFEDLTEEIGETPDYDYETPMCIVEEELDGVQKAARLRCRFTGRYRVSLYYDGVKVAEFWWGKLAEAPQLTYVDVQALAQQIRVAPALPAFDYIVDIYSDKVVVTDASGNTTQLSTIADLNNWLRNITGKRIRINANVEVYNDIYLSPNEYWVFGGWIHGNIYLTSRDITIVSFTRLGDATYGGYVTNRDPQTGGYIDVSGLRLYSVYADVIIYGTSNMVIKGVVIHIEYSSYVDMQYIEGDIYVHGAIVGIANSTLRNALIDTGYLSVDNVVGGDWLGTWMLISHIDTTFKGPITARDLYYVYLDLRATISTTLAPGGTAEIQLPSINITSPMKVRVESMVCWEVTAESNIEKPPPPELTYVVDYKNWKLILSNKSTSECRLEGKYKIMAGY
jgi:hypothetical protein